MPPHWGWEPTIHSTWPAPNLRYHHIEPAVKKQLTTFAVMFNENPSVEFEIINRGKELRVSETHKKNKYGLQKGDKLISVNWHSFPDAKSAVEKLKTIEPPFRTVFGRWEHEATVQVSGSDSLTDDDGDDGTGTIEHSSDSDEDFEEEP
eukprot:UN03702